MPNELIPIEIIENKIFVFRDHKVMLDSDLADLYGVETKNLNKAVKRNIDRFPEDFMFQLTDEEWESLRFQIGTSKEGKGGRRFSPYVFTEHGVLMLSNVLGSKRAITVSIQILRVFTKLKKMAIAHNELTTQLNELEQRFITYAKDTNIELSEHDRKINEILKCLQELVKTDKPKHIGFKIDD